MNKRLFEIIAPNEKGFAKVGDFEFRLPTTAADFCFVVDVYYFCLALFVEPELKLNSELMLIAHSSSPTFAKPYVGRLCFFLCRYVFGSLCRT